MGRILSFAILCLLVARPAFAMHISEGLLPFSWALLWHLVRGVGGSLALSGFIAGVLADWGTYAATSFILASGIRGC